MSTWLTDPEAFESLFRAAPSGIAAVDRKGLFVGCNPAFTRLTGLSDASVAGRSVRELQNVGFRVFAEEALDAAHAAGSLARDIEFPQDGAVSVWCEVTSIPVGGSGIVHVLFSLQDVTWRKNASPSATAEIGQLRANFRLLFEHNPATVIAIDTQNRITDVNPAGLRESGYLRDDLIGQDATAFVPPSQRDRLRLFLRQAFGGETVTFPLDSYAADGRLIQYEATALPIIAANRVVGVYGLLANVTERMRAERTVAAQREELIDLETDFRSLFDHNPDGIILFTQDATIVDVNDAAIRISARPREELVGQKLEAFLRPDVYQRVSGFFDRATAGESVRYNVEAVRGDGTELVTDVTLFPKFAQGVVVGVYCVMQDITERHVANRKSETRAQRIRDLYLLATAPEYSDAQFMTTLQTGCRLLAMESGAIVDTGGTPRIDVRHDSLEIFSGDDDAALALASQVLAAQETVAAGTGEQQGPYPTWIGSRLFVGGVVHGVLLFFSRTPRSQPFEEVDLDTLALMSALVGSALERRRSRSRLRTLAYSDSLTGLPNRAFFQERLRDALVDMRGRSQPVAVMYFDLDRFKDINDTLGHAMGDRFLQLVAQRLTRVVGDEGVVARMGGDEFAVLLPNCRDGEQITALAERLLHAIELPYRLDEFEQFITTSIGLSIYPEDGRDDQTLIKNADIAMYEVKDRGGNAYLFYNESLEAPIQTRLAQEKTLRRAIEREEFVIHYQPIVNVATEDLAGVEALVRWQDPERGLLFPDAFIPTAEATGLIVQLGEWIAAASAKQIREWHERFGPISLAVNLSTRQFHQPNLCERMREALKAADLDPRWVAIEITESMAMSDVAHAVAIIRDLKEMGVHIGVDDFGTGHSSLNYLRRFEVDHIKIDRSFIAGIGHEHSDETIVKAIIALGHSLGLQIVAEGVETREQLDFLREHRCDKAQGYLFSRPVDAPALEALIGRMRGGAPAAG